MAVRFSMSALYPAFSRVKSAFLSYLLVAPLMVIALSAPDAARTQEQDARQAADKTL